MDRLRSGSSVGTRHLALSVLLFASADLTSAASALPASATTSATRKQLGARLGAPCDILASGGTPCQAAHALTRPLYAGYSGPLYQVMRMRDGAQLDVHANPTTGVADAAAQDAFCSSGFCMVHRIYDQSPNKNHLELAPPGGAAPTWDRGVNASAHMVFVKRQGQASATGGSGDSQLVPVYGAFFEGGMGYRQDVTRNIAKDDEPETMYAVMNGRIFNDKCCFDYGNAETDNNDDGEGTMETIYFGSNARRSHGFGTKGPWVMADLENGLWAGSDVVVNQNTPVDADFVTAMVKGDSNDHFALKAGDASSPAALALKYDGKRPANPKYKVMKKQGAIILGIGGDNSDAATGVFYEGVMVKGFTSDAVDADLQASIAAAGYALSRDAASAASVRGEGETVTFI